jgi:hypothetical protein
MTKFRPIAPTKQVIDKWLEDAETGDPTEPDLDIVQFANRAAHYGANQELAACCDALESMGDIERTYGAAIAGQLVEIRRPQAPNLKTLGLEALGRFSTNSHVSGSEMAADFEVLRQIVEQFPDA